MNQTPQDKVLKLKMENKYKYISSIKV